MPKMRVTELGRSRLYLTRDMIAGDVADIEPQCVEAAKALGYVEDIGPEPVRAARRSAEAAEPTRKELLELAEERGIELPSGYVSRDKLAELIKNAEQDDAEEG